MGRETEEEENEREEEVGVCGVRISVDRGIGCRQVTPRRLRSSLVILFVLPWVRENVLRRPGYLKREHEGRMEHIQSHSRQLERLLHVFAGPRLVPHAPFDYKRRIPWRVEMACVRAGGTTSTLLQVSVQLILRKSIVFSRVTRHHTLAVCYFPS